MNLVLPERQGARYNISETARKYQYIRRQPYRLHISRIREGDNPERTDCQMPLRNYALRNQGALTHCLIIVRGIQRAHDDIIAKVSCKRVNSRRAAGLTVL